jgi:hypothetical protein
MRKIVGLLVGIALMTLVTDMANAQLRFGVKGGLNIASVRFDKDIISAENVTGFHIGPTIELMVPYIGLGLDGAILYSQKGLYSEMRTISTDYIDVPVNFKWKFGIPVVKGFLATGPYASICVNKGNGESVSSSIKTQIEAKSFGAGWNFGGGVELFGSLQVGFNYGLGLTNDYSASKTEDIANGKSNLMSVTATLLF